MNKNVELWNCGIVELGTVPFSTGINNRLEIGDSNSQALKIRHIWL